MQIVKPLLLVLLTCSLLSCETTKPGTTTMGAEKTSRCGELPAGVTIDKRAFRLAGLKLGEFSLGEVDVNSTPEFTQILSEASKDKVVQGVLACNAIELAGVQNNPEMVAHFIETQNFLATNPSVDDRIKWRKASPFPKVTAREPEVKEPKVEITFNGLSQEAIKSKFPIPLVLEPTQTAILTFVVANVGDGPVLNSHVSIDAAPDTIRVGRPRTMEAHEERPDHNRIEIKGKPSLLTVKMAGGAYSFKVEVKVPAGTERFDILFRIYADNLPHQEFGLVFRPIHYKQPEAK
jgi:hypothetical protein